MRAKLILVAILLCAASIRGQFAGQAPGPGHSAILYTSNNPEDPVALLNRRLLNGTAELKFDNTFGYLPALLDALAVPRESQIMVFSKTSLQSMLIGPANPRAILFNDAVAIAFVRGTPMLEVASQDPQQGIMFYTLDQSLQTRPVLNRESVCLGCHNTPESLGVPGTVVQTVFPRDTGALVTGLIGAAVDHRTPFEERWGGWYITGEKAPPRHRANIVLTNAPDGAPPPAPPAPARLRQKFETTGYPTPYSDVVALTVFEHQMHMMNLITRMGWQTRAALYEDPMLLKKENIEALRAGSRELVDYLLFVDEAPLTGPIEGTSGFAARFAAQGPFDNKGRSLRQLDLRTRLMRYPCSYMIYSDAFGALPVEAKNEIYQRMWEILSGHESSPRYERLTPGDRRAIVEIMRATLKDLPEYVK